jgi:glycosyltransferase involved in cell wall biosynthesis
VRLGLLARADNSGLGIQTWEFYKAMHPDKTMVVDISKLNGNQIFPERYPDATFVRGIPIPSEIERFLRDLDVVFLAEAPYNYYLYELAKAMNVKVANQYNYEFFDWFVHPDWPKPDMLIAPSKWHYSQIDEFANANGIKHTYLHCPVNRDALKCREIHQARTFLHTAGRSASHDRNGTKTVIEASRLLTTPAKIVIHFQGEQGLAHQTTMTTADYRQHAEKYGDPEKLTIVTQEFTNYADAYAMGDVLLLPRRYGGNCLPMNEALACGMPVIMSNISPNNQFLPQNWLVHAEKISEFTPRTTIDIYQTDPAKLAKKIDMFYNMDEAQMLTQSLQARNKAEGISWPNMEWQYRQAFEDLCTP